MAAPSLGVLTRSDSSARRHHHTGAGAGDHDDMGALEVALLRRSLAGVGGNGERCGRCRRTVLLGERVYEYAAGVLRCELCRVREEVPPSDSHRVRGPEWGHSIRVTDQRNSR